MGNDTHKMAQNQAKQQQNISDKINNITDAGWLTARLKVE